jgi:uncharacterized protein involved in type VI secretion and phage assembly
MNLPFIDDRLPAGLGGRYYGVYPAIVVDNQDPDGQGRVKVKLPWSAEDDDTTFEVWARLATMMAGGDRGTWFIPDAEDEVLVSFGGGDPRQAFVVGALWNGSDAPPASIDTQNTKKLIKSRNGVTVTLDDTSGQEAFIVETPGGQRITLQDGPGSVTVEDSNGNSVVLETQGITVQASAKVTVTASLVEVSASMVTVNAGMSRFSGVVQCDTLIATTVVGTTYTPGAGNIW